MVLAADKGDIKSVIINGTRPSPLSIRRDSSHTTKKQSFPWPKQQPNIIYAHSPKIIHAKPREFMELVQRLTGKETALREQTKKEGQVEVEVKNENFWAMSQGFLADMPQETALREQPKKEEQVEVEVKNENFWAMSQGFLADMPLFTPNSASFLLSSSPGHMFRYSETLSPSPNTANFSSTFFEAKKGLH